MSFSRSKKMGYPVNILLRKIFEVSRESGYKKVGTWLSFSPSETTSALTTTRGQAVIEGIAQGLGGLEDLGMAWRQAVVRSLSHQLQTSVPHHLRVCRNTAFASTWLPGLRKTSRVSFTAGYGIAGLVAPLK